MNKIFKYVIIAVVSAAFTLSGGCADNTFADNYPNIEIDLDDDTQGYPHQNLGVIDAPENTLLPIASGTADYVGVKVIDDEFKNGKFYQSGGGINSAFDGNIATTYHSPWKYNEGYYPVELEFTLAGTPEKVEYITLVPRPGGGGNGVIKDLELFVKRESDADFVSYGRKRAGDGPVVYDFSPALEDPRIVKVVAYDGVGGFVSLAEIECGVRHNPYLVDMRYFTDELCTKLKDGVSREELEGIATPFFKNLALAMFDKTYDVENRVHDIKTYPAPDFKAKYNKTAKYGILDNATGMYVDWNDNVVIFVEDNLVANMSIRLVNPMKGFSALQVQPLSPGINVFKAKEKGLLYVIYQGDKGTTTKVHIATGKVNGVYDLENYANETEAKAAWRGLLDKTSFTHLDILGKYTHLILTVVDLKAYANDDGYSLVSTYDKICEMEQDFAGFKKYTFTASAADGGGEYSRMNDTRLCMIALNSTSHMFASDYYTGYSLKSLSEIMDVANLKGKGIWGPAHELGHVNQIRPGFKWGSGSVGGDLTEVTNNVYSLYIQTEINADDPNTPNNRSRLLVERHYQSAFNRFFVSEQPFADGMGYLYCFEKLVPLWQLQLYFAKVKDNNDYYKDLLEAIRLDSSYDAWGTASAQQVNYCKNRFALHASRTAQLNLVQFFQDYRFELLPATIDEIVAMGYPAPEHQFRYIHDENTQVFRENKAVIGGSASVNVIDGDYKIFINDDCKNATAFEVYIPSDQIRPVMVTIDHEFTVMTSAKRVIIKAVGADGQKVDVAYKTN